MANAAVPHAPAGGALIELLRDARARTTAYTGDLDGERLFGPRLAIINPVLWEIGHLAWFQERWCLRYQGEGEPLAPSILEGADALYDSSAVPNPARWDLPLPSLPATLGYMDAVLARVAEKIDRGQAGEYFVWLSLLHEDMHGEAFLYTRQTLAYPRPVLAQTRAQTAAGSLRGDAQIPGGELMLGSEPGQRFVFDNEKWAHPVRVPAFCMARAAVSNRDYLEFVEDGGYRRQDLWCSAGWSWRELAAAAHPVYWRKDGGKWLQRMFDQERPLPPDAPVIHVNWFEADAYCRWAGRRLPSEAEWEMAASQGARPDTASQIKRSYPWGAELPTPERVNLDGWFLEPVDVAALPMGDSPGGIRQLMGNVWEWTADWFLPYPGFSPDPYQDYSQPWFGNHKVLRGGCYATRARLIHSSWRNFYMPDRRDVLAGFRTCALS